MQKATISVLVVIVTLHWCFTSFQWLKSTEGQAGGGDEQAPVALPVQGRLLTQAGTQAGVPLDAGTAEALFTIYDSPIGTSDNYWSSGKVQLSVKPGGFITTILGSKENPLDRIDFSEPHYLGVKVRNPASTGPIENEPEMFPRIQIMPAMYARKAGRARIAYDADLLAGRNWSSILVNGQNDPEEFKIRGVRIEGIGTEQIAVGAVHTGKIASGAVTNEKLAPANFKTSDPSQPINFRRFLTGTNYVIPQTVTIKTSGRPVWVGLRPTNQTGPLGACVRISGSEPIGIEFELIPRFPALRTCFGMGDSSDSLSDQIESLIPLRAISFIDNPAAGEGERTYQLSISNRHPNSPLTVEFDGLQLFAFELSSSLPEAEKP